MSATPVGSAKPALRTSGEPYRVFVADSDSIDLIDYVAYALYKRRKLDFVQSFASANNRAPTAEEVENFILAATLPDSVESFRAAATETLRTFSEGVLSEAETEVEDRYKLQFVEELSKARPFWRMLAENILANIGALVFVALVLVVIYGSRIGVVNLIGEVFGYEIKARADSGQQTGAAPPARPASQ